MTKDEIPNDEGMTMVEVRMTKRLAVPRAVLPLFFTHNFLPLSLLSLNRYAAVWRKTEGEKLRVKNGKQEVSLSADSGSFFGGLGNNSPHRLAERVAEIAPKSSPHARAGDRLPSRLPKMRIGTRNTRPGSAETNVIPGA
jgi:hypothetical protein